MDNLFLELFHTLNNDFIVIRAAIKIIEANINQPKTIEKKIALIEKTLDKAYGHLDATQLLLQKPQNSPESK